MKQIKKLAVLGFTLLFSLSAWSQDFELDGLRFQLSGGSATVLGQVAGATETDINIPASVPFEGMDYPVTTIADGAWGKNCPISYGCTGYGTANGAVLTSVTIPDSVTTIGSYAFRLNALTEVTIPNSVTTIATGAFQSNELTSVTIPDSVTTIESSAFSGNDLTSVTIPNSVTTIEELAFSGNDLTSVTIPNSVTTIGSGAFNSNDLTSVIIPDSVSKIGAGAFLENRLTSVTIPASVTTIEVAAFAGNFVDDESGGRTDTLESVTFEGEYTEWMPDPEGVFFGTGISPEAFVVKIPNFEFSSRSLSTISVCPSASWDNVTFELEIDVLQPLGVTQDPAACPFVDPVVLIDELSAFVAQLNAKNGILNALDAKLGAVQGALSDLNENNDVAALNAMYAFCYNAQAQSGKQLETADADALIAKADAIIAAIDPDAALCSE